MSTNLQFSKKIFLLNILKEVFGNFAEKVGTSWGGAGPSSGQLLFSDRFGLDFNCNKIVSNKKIPYNRVYLLSYILTCVITYFLSS